MKILTAQQVKVLESNTLQAQSISEYDLTKRAGEVLAKAISKKLLYHSEFIFFCGTGKNGADGLVCAKNLALQGHKCKVIIFKLGKAAHPVFLKSLDTLDQTLIKVEYINSLSTFPVIGTKAIIVDALIGTGLNKPITGPLEQIIEKINTYKSNITIAVDTPTGLGSELSAKSKSVINADVTFTFESPKLDFFFADNYPKVGDWEILPIKLDKKSLNKIETNNYYLDPLLVKKIAKKLRRLKFAHKGDFGHTLVIAGSKGKIGSAVLTTKSAVKIGSGLVTSYIPSIGYDILQISVPEAMTITDRGFTHISDNIFDINQYSSIVVGPGIGTEMVTKKAFEEFINKATRPIVIDADAINLISQDISIIDKIPQNSILTPHPKEFDRLVGASSSSIERFEKQKNFSKRYKQIIILKGAHTSITLPNGDVYFNSTGNPGMATGGSGDVLAGVIAGLMAQGLNSENASLLGVYIHGLAGDFAKREVGKIGISAGDIVGFLPNALSTLHI